MASADRSRDGVGASATMADMAMRRLDGGRLRGDIVLAGVVTDNPTALQKWNRPDSLRAAGRDRRTIVEAAGCGFTLGPAA